MRTCAIHTMIPAEPGWKAKYVEPTPDRTEFFRDVVAWCTYTVSGEPERLFGSVSLRAEGDDCCANDPDQTEENFVELIRKELSEKSFSRNSTL